MDSIGMVKKCFGTGSNEYVLAKRVEKLQKKDISLMQESDFREVALGILSRAF